MNRPLSTVSGDEAYLSYLRATSRPVAPSDAPLVGVVDLFCGGGGMSLGADQALCRSGRRMSVTLGVDSNAAALATYVENHSPVSSTEEDILRVVGDGRLESLAPATQILLGGPPCQGNSSLNNHTRHEDARIELYMAMADAAEQLSPDVVLVENVPEITKARSQVLRRAMDRLEGLGFQCLSLPIDPKELGLPQSRPRHLLVATRHGLGGKLAEGLRRWRPAVPRSAMWAIRDLETTEGERPFHRTTRVHVVNQERIDHLFEHDLYELPNPQRPGCHHGDHSYKSMYGRIRPDVPAQTITTGFTSPGQGRTVHPTQRRMITPHEAARLQGFPDFYRFDATTKLRTVWQKVIGNAVPPRLSEAVLSEILLHQPLSAFVSDERGRSDA